LRERWSPGLESSNWQLTRWIEDTIIDSVMEVRHCTTRDTLRFITHDKLRIGSWVTTAHVESLHPDQRVKALELDDNRKGECACRVKVYASDLAVPRRQPLTSSGYPQLKTLLPLTVAEVDCTCKSRYPWGAILLIGGLCLAALVIGIRSRRNSPPVIN